MEKPTNPTSNKFAAFFEKPPVRVAYGLLGLALAYIFASWAIDTGSLLDYAITILLIIIGVRELVGGGRNWKK